MKEIWKNIEGYEGFYQVSNLGRVKSLKRKWIAGTNSKRFHEEIIIKNDKSNRGYCRVELSNGEKRRKYSIHRLVAFAFIPNPENKPCVNHKDTNKQNNRVDNLEWCTYKENTNHAKNLGLIFPGNKKRIKCINNNMIYDSIAKASKKLNLSRSYIIALLKNHYIPKTKNCFRFKYMEN